MPQTLADRAAEFARRTNLLRILTLYASSAFVALQLVDMFAGRLRLPEWLFPATLALVIGGLPIVLLAVVARNRRSVSDARPHASQDAHRHRLTWRHVGLSVVGLFAAWGLIAAGWLMLGPEPGERPADAVIRNGSLRVNAEPASALTLRRVQPFDSLMLGEAHELATSETHELPAGEYLLGIAASGYNAVEILASIVPDETLEVGIDLVRADATVQDMLHVPAQAGTAAFLIDRYEVTNAQYLEFVRSGAYTNDNLWPAHMLIEGTLQPRPAALRTFVDQTGSSGPRGWSGGLYPSGTADHPVTGITWYEAAAYARSLGKQLPTWQQWWSAALTNGRTLPWGTDTESIEARSNFNLAGTAPVGAHPLGVSHAGVHDMAGNVREWIRDPPPGGEQRIVAGGSWQDPVYVFDPKWEEAFPPDFSSEAIGFRCVLEVEPT